MRIIPVIDLKGGCVVRGVGGRRDEYRPVDSVLCADAEPGAVAEAFARRLGFDEAYVADLDAIAGAEPAWELYCRMAGAGLRLWIDAGLSSAARARRLAAFLPAADRPLAAVIAGLESLASPDDLATLLEAVGPDRLVFSLDLKASAPLTGSPAWRGLEGGAIALRAWQAGVRRMIVLDLARVGTGQGAGTESLCRQLRQLGERLELVAGGGIRGTSDLMALADAGCDAALVASALHDGRLGPADLAAFR